MFNECDNDYDNDCEAKCNNIDQGVGYTCDCPTGYRLNDDDLNCDGLFFFISLEVEIPGTEM